MKINFIALINTSTNDARFELLVLMSVCTVTGVSPLSVTMLILEVGRSAGDAR